MAARRSEEKGLLGPSNRPHRRYGSTSVNMKRPESVLRHRVSKQDTLQGIALRYGVTMETLKQHNKLWSIEAMFLHDYLEVPVSRSVYETVTGSSAESPQTPSSSSQFNGSDRSSDTSTSSPSSTPKVSRSPSTSSGLHDCSETNPTDFLSKIDSNIALMKSSIERMETHAYPMVDRMEVDESQCHNGRRSYHSKVRESSYQNGWHDATDAPHPVVNPGRTITMSLKRLLREHEELYEL
ncbi:lysM and putative peptidoglycan-binding domain-containing protein 2-like [Penaeus indicus]|uniref:lysM and putative peptidoglycan-binding domain-containing protein 2-like n=1 Tax=Penaeus indicus TaxID=29960 RepID=UPI00300DA8DC